MVTAPTAILAAVPVSPLSPFGYKVKHCGKGGSRLLVTLGKFGVEVVTVPTEMAASPLASVSPVSPLHPEYLAPLVGHEYQ